jgi:hypothetical protein
MKKLMMAVLAGFMSIAVAGAYAGEAKGDEMKSEKGMAKSEKGMAKSEAKSEKGMTKSEKGMAKKSDKEDKMKKGEATK